MAAESDRCQGSFWTPSLTPQRFSVDYSTILFTFQYHCYSIDCSIVASRWHNVIMNVCRRRLDENEVQRYPKGYFSANTGNQLALEPCHQI